MALHLLGEIVSLRTPLDIETAARHYGSAVALANNLGMRPLIARCHLGLSVLHWRTGKRREADEHLRGAATMLREMQMRFWLEKVEAELHDIAG